LIECEVAVEFVVHVASNRFTGRLARLLTWAHEHPATEARRDLDSIDDGRSRSVTSF
jgi:hypothetical protein